jgi:polyphosphate kinase
MHNESLLMAREKNNNGEKRLKRKRYEKELRRLQAELCKLQDWVKYKGLRIMVVFEGRDAAGKGEPSERSRSALAHAFFALLPCPHHRTAKDLKCTFSAI